MSEDKRVLLFSGGIDSFIAYRYLGRPKTVYFNLRTPYSDYEIRVIKELIPDTIIDNSLNLASRQIPSDTAAHIPMRNLYLAMLACKYGDEIIICGLKDDKVNDKTPEAFKEMSTLLTSLNDRPIKVTSPFWNMTKAEIVKWYIDTYPGNWDKLHQTISCYTPDKDNGTSIKRYCGKCQCCFRKWNALWVNGIETPFYNLVLMKDYLIRARQEHYTIERNASIHVAIDEFARKFKHKYLGKIYRVDIDGVLTEETEGHDYATRTPKMDVIKKVNLLYLAGAEIILWTSRYPEDCQVTSMWLEANNVQYDGIEFGKPQYDVLIDDKAMEWEYLEDIEHT